jgi:DNA-binding LacI/PurR family transcriptional regulator
MGKRVTMKEIADTLDLSVNAVSLALNDLPGVSEETKRRILKTANDMGYLDQASRFNKVYAKSCICILIKKQYYTSNFYSRVIYGVEKEAKKNGYNVILQFFSDKDEVPDFIKKRKVCGAVILGAIEEEYLKRIYNEGVPIVLADHSSYSLPIDCILTDNRIGAYESVANLISQGYRKIGFFGEFSYSLSNKERFWGYVEAMQKIEPDFQKLFQLVSRYSILGEIENYVINRDTEAIARIIEKQEYFPEVYQCSNDRSAILLSNALKLLKIKIPEDIGLVGFDDGEMASAIYPKLTTVHVANVRMGIKAFERLIWKLQNPKSPPEKILMAVELVIRDSIKTKD